MTQFWKNLGQPEIDGIVAVDVPMIQKLLDVYGPLEIPESKVPVTASNLMDQLTDVVQHQGSGTIEQQRKKAVISLSTELVNRVTDLTSDQLLPTIDSLMRSADEKRLQIYLLDPTAQADMVAVGWAGALDPPEGTTDLVGVSNRDVEPSKANIGVTKSLDYEVQLKAGRGCGNHPHAGIPEERAEARWRPREGVGQLPARPPACRNTARACVEGHVHVTGRPHRCAHVRPPLPASSRVPERGPEDHHAASPASAPHG